MGRARSAATLLGILLLPAITRVSMTCGSSPSVADVVRHHRDTLTTGGGRTRFSRVGARRFPRNGSASGTSRGDRGPSSYSHARLRQGGDVGFLGPRQSGYAVEISLGAVFPRFEPGKPPPDSSTAVAEIVERVTQAPGVVHAAAISCNMPLGSSSCGTSMTAPGRELPDKGRISISGISPDYHTTRVPLRRGRLFEDTNRKAPGVAIINEAAARKYFPDESPIGRSVMTQKIERAIVGIVGDVHPGVLPKVNDKLVVVRV
jgi:hypothetical protein